MKFFYVFSEQELVKKTHYRIYKVDSIKCLALQGIYSLSFLKDGYGGKTMAYTKPQVVAQNAATGSYAAGCPTGQGGSTHNCRTCERTY